MKVEFNIEYRTEWGESLSVVVADRKYPMKWSDGGQWSVAVDGLSEEDLRDYTYVVMRDGLIERPEWESHSYAATGAKGIGRGRTVGTECGKAGACCGEKGATEEGLGGSGATEDGRIVIRDRWNDCPIEGCRFPRKHSAAKFDEPGFRGAGLVIPIFSLRSPDDFGIGEFTDLIPVIDWAAATGQTVIQLLPVTDTTRRGLWEDSYPYSPVSSFALNPMYISLKGLGVGKGDGNGVGNGDCKEDSKEVGNGTGKGDGWMRYVPEPETESLRKELNDLPEIDYPRVFALKMGILRKLFAVRGEADLATPAFQAFRRENAFWLSEYSSFCARRDADFAGNMTTEGVSHDDCQNTARSMAAEGVSHDDCQNTARSMAAESDSPDNCQNTARSMAAEDDSPDDCQNTARSMAEMGDEGGETAVKFYEWVQFWLDRQFGEVADYARAKGISLKGDLPIGVSGDSADAHWHPELFNLDSSTGAPPDFFSADGQNWGFPTYNWETMAKDDYRWWKMRLRKMARWFDAYRIDHILGFFRIWEIPREFASGRFGHFNPALPYSPADLAAAGLPLTDEAGCAAVVSSPGEASCTAVVSSPGEAGFAPGLPRPALFVPDPRNPGMYQPIIAPERPSGLSDWQWHRFWALHDDFFFRRNDGFWRRNAMRKLPELLGATGMLACGEDLGMVPDCVDGVMAREAILTLEMPGFDKGHPWPECAVCATSSHDMETLRMKFAREHPTPEGSSPIPGQDAPIPGQDPSARSAASVGQDQSEGQNTAIPGQDPNSGTAPIPGQDPSAGQVREILRGLLSASPMLAIFPLQDWIALDEDFRRRDFTAERINEPANPHHHWRFRLHFNVSELLDRSELTKTVADLLRETGRYR